MRRARILLAAVIAALLIAPAAESADRKTPAMCAKHPVLTKANDAQRRANKAWNADKVKKNKKAIKRVRAQARCVPGKKGRKHVRAAIRDARRDYKAAKKEQELASSLTPYNCGSSGNWAIPCAIVYCESKYSWGAYNPSGAVGPYQLLGKGAPFPVNSDSDKAVHHRIASDLWAGGAGASHWAQCL